MGLYDWMYTESHPSDLMFWSCRGETQLCPALGFGGPPLTPSYTGHPSLPLTSDLQEWVAVWAGWFRLADGSLGSSWTGSPQKIPLQSVKSCFLVQELLLAV